MPGDREHVLVYVEPGGGAGLGNSGAAILTMMPVPKARVTHPFSRLGVGQLDQVPSPRLEQRRHQVAFMGLGGDGDLLPDAAALPVRGRARGRLASLVGLVGRGAQRAQERLWLFGQREMAGVVEHVEPPAVAAARLLRGPQGRHPVSATPDERRLGADPAHIVRRDLLQAELAHQPPVGLLHAGWAGSVHHVRQKRRPALTQLPAKALEIDHEVPQHP